MAISEKNNIDKVKKVMNAVRLEDGQGSGLDVDTVRSVEGVDKAGASGNVRDIIYTNISPVVTNVHTVVATIPIVQYTNGIGSSNKVFIYPPVYYDNYRDDSFKPVEVEYQVNNTGVWDDSLPTTNVLLMINEDPLSISLPTVDTYIVRARVRIDGTRWSEWLNPVSITVQFAMASPVVPPPSITSLTYEPNTAANNLLHLKLRLSYTNNSGNALDLIVTTIRNSDLVVINEETINVSVGSSITDVFMNSNWFDPSINYLIKIEARETDGDNNEFYSVPIIKLYDPVDIAYNDPSLIPGINAVINNVSISMAPLPEGKNRHGQSTLVTGDILVTGGLGPNGITDKCFLYSTATDSWTEVARLPMPMYNHNQVTYKDGRVLVFGGITNLGVIGIGYIYYPDIDRWESVSSNAFLTTGSAHIFIDDDKLLVVGGKAIYPDGSVVPENRIDIYDINTEATSFAGYLSIPGGPNPYNYGFGIFRNAVGGYYMVGGESYSNHTPNHDVYAYTLDLSILGYTANILTPLATLFPGQSPGGAHTKIVTGLKGDPIICFGSKKEIWSLYSVTGPGIESFDHMADVNIYKYGVSEIKPSAIATNGEDSFKGLFITGGSPTDSDTPSNPLVSTDTFIL